MTLVVDASVALKWFLSEEPFSAQALAVVRDGALLIAPDLLIAEVCNAAWRSARLGRIHRRQVTEIASVLPRLFHELASTAVLAPRAVAMAAALDHPVYDCLYVALAEARQARLVTADGRLLDKLRQSSWGANALPLSDYDAAG
jgi:predicted nucleic acid-binding protein